MTIADEKDPTKPNLKNPISALKRMSRSDVDIHHYGGEDTKGRQSSALVVGFKDDDGTWEFYAQITKGATVILAVDPGYAQGPEVLNNRYLIRKEDN